MITRILEVAVIALAFLFAQGCATTQANSSKDAATTAQSQPARLTISDVTFNNAFKDSNKPQNGFFAAKHWKGKPQVMCYNKATRDDISAATLQVMLDHLSARRPQTAEERADENFNRLEFSNATVSAPTTESVSTASTAKAEAFATATVNVQVKDAPRDYNSKKGENVPSVAYKQMYAPNWGGNVRQRVFYDGCDGTIFSRYPESDEMKRFWELLATLPPKTNLKEWDNSYYARWVPVNGKWTLVEGSLDNNPTKAMSSSPAPAADETARLKAENAALQAKLTAKETAETAKTAPAPAAQAKPETAKKSIPAFSQAECVNKLKERGYEGAEGIKKFQRKYALTADGVAGATTCAQLRNVLAACTDCKEEIETK